MKAQTIFTKIFDTNIAVVNKMKTITVAKMFYFAVNRFYSLFFY